MNSETHLLLAEHPDWQAVLRLYHDLIDDQAIERDSEESGTRWTQRIAGIGEIDSESLTEIHGQLIAMNWLTFHLEDNQTGLMYRITGEGRRTLQAVEKLEATNHIEHAA